jgi:hypothetical protein
VAEPQVAVPPKLAVLRAWRGYLNDTKDLRHENYHEVEPWAWDKLQAQLKKLKH